MIIRDGLGLPQGTTIGQSHLYLWLGTRREFLRTWCASAGAGAHTD